jgi:putative DNA primase/helicase
MSATGMLEASPSVQVGNIPRELRALPQWTFWRFEPDPNGGKDKKVPRNPRTGRNASPTDPATWGTFEATMDALERFGGDGVQFLLSASDPYTGIDLDACVNPDTGEVAPWAAQIVACFDAYTEVSPSGTGLRIMTQGKKPEGAPAHCHQIEVYDHAKALTITGNVHRKGTIRDRQAQVEWLCLAMKPLARALAGTNGEKVSLLFAGRWREVTDQKGSAYPSQNEADLAFCGLLALAGATEEQIDAAMWLSGLYREKWETAGYRERTITKAMDGETPAALYSEDDEEDEWPSLDVSALDTGNDRDLLQFGPDDQGNAGAVVELYGKSFLYCREWGWLAYNSTHWTTEGADAALQKAIMWTLRRRHMAAKRARSKVMKAATKSNIGRIRGAKSLLEGLLHAEVSEFDQRPDHLNVANGVLDLRTGELERHSHTQRFTYCLLVPYDPDADASLWEGFLAQVIAGGQEVLDCFQMCVGYTLPGHTNEEKLFYLYGNTGRNGKGTFTETLLALFGSRLGKEVAFGTFTRDRDHDAQNFDLAGLTATRFLAASESYKYDKLNEAQVKQLTGGNDVYCAHKHKAHFSYRPHFKIWLSANYDVSADPSDRAVWGRIVRFVFPVTFLGNEDTTLKARLKSLEHLAGVLAWAVEGAKSWYAPPKGLAVPQSLVEGLQAVRYELDTIQQWLDDAIEREPAAWVSHKDAYDSYMRWCRAQRHQRVMAGS